jgi:hypothetical protein
MLINLATRENRLRRLLMLPALSAKNVICFYSSLNSGSGMSGEQRSPIHSRNDGNLILFDLIYTNSRTTDSHAHIRSVTLLGHVTQIKKGKSSFDARLATSQPLACLRLTHLHVQTPIRPHSNYLQHTRDIRTHDGPKEERLTC